MMIVILMTLLRFALGLSILWVLVNLCHFFLVKDEVSHPAFFCLSNALAGKLKKKKEGE